MNGAIASVLNKVLGDWIENLDAENLNLSVFSGEILLGDLNLKPEAFSNLGLPFSLVYGHVGKISAKIPWSSLGSSPLKVLIEDVHIFISPISVDQWQFEIEKARYEAQKLSLLRQIDTLNNNAVEAKTPGFMEKLVTKIVDNLQIEIKNVYFQYTDEISGNSKFSFGFVIGNAKAVTCNNQWKEVFVEGSSVMYKLLQVSDFKVFLDYENIPMSGPKEIVKNEFENVVNHNFMICKTTLRLEAIVNKNAKDFEIPQVQLEFKSQELGLVLDTFQIKHAIKALNFLKLFSNFQKGVVTTVKSLEEPFNAEDGEKYRNLLIQTKTQIKNKEKALKVQQEIEEYEKLKTWDSIKQQKALANKEFELIQIEAATKQELESATSGPSTLSRFTGFFSRKSDSSEEEKKEKIEKIKEKLNKINEEKARLASDLESLVSDSELIENFPENFIRFKFSFVIQSFYLSVCEGSLNLLRYNVIMPNFRMSLAPNFFIFQAGITSSELLDLQESLIFSHIFKSSNYEINVTNKSGLSVNMNSGDLEFVLKVKSVMRTVVALKNAVVEDLDVSAITGTATDKTKEYISAGEQYLSAIMTTGIKSSVKLDIHLKAPTIFVPIDVTNETKGVLVIDLGSIDIVTKSEEIENNLYDKYIFKLNDFKVFHTCRYLTDDANDIMIVLPLTYEITLFNSLTSNYSVPNFILDLNLSSLSVNVQDIILKFLLDLKDQLLLDLKDVPKPPELPSNLIEQAPNIQISLIMKFNVQISNILINVIKDNQSLASLEINGMTLQTISEGSEKVKSQFNLSFIELRDNRHGVIMNKVICNPLLQPQEDEFADAVEDLNQISGEFELFNKKKSVKLHMSDLRISLAHDFCGQLLGFFDFAFKTHNNSKEIHPNKEKIETQELLLNDNVECKVELSNITLLFPLDVNNLSKRVGLFNISILLEYSLEKIVENQKYLKYYENLEVKFKKIVSIIGLFNNNTVKNTIQKKVNLLDQTQFSISYTKSLKEISQITADLQADFEKISLGLGFRDLDFSNRILKNWLAILPQKGPDSEEDPGIQETTLATPLKIKIRTESIELRLSDDTIFNQIPLLYFVIYKIDLGGSINATEKSFNVTTKLYAQCYNNIKNSLTAEALIEDWEVIAGIKTRNGEVPYDISIVSQDMLNINISANMLRTIAQIKKKFSQNTEIWEAEICDEASLSFVWILNDLGEDIILNAPNENSVILVKNQKFKVKNQNKTNEKFNSHIIIQADNSDQVYIEIESKSKEFAMKRGSNFIGCILQTVENAEETTFRLKTESEFYNFTSVKLEVSSKHEKIEIFPGQKVSFPLSWNNSELKILTDSGPAQFSNSFVYQNGYFTIEKLSVKDSLNYLHLLYIFFPSFYIQNLMPCKVNVLHQGNNSTRFGLLPGETSILGINPKSLGRIQLELEQDQSVISEWTELLPNITKIRIPENSNRLMLESSEYDVYSHLIGYTQITKNINCKILQIYSKYLFLNKSTFDLEIKKSLVLRKKTLNFLRIKRDKIKLRAIDSNKISGWCKDINLKTVGISGCINFDNSKNSVPQEIILGVQINNAPAPMIKTKMIVISPRFILSNYFSSEIFVRQVINNKPGNSIKKVSSENVEFQLENSFESKLIQISTNNKYWSSSFNVEEVAEFQVCLESLPSERMDSAPWYLPGPSNDYRTFVLVVISTDDDCSINIHFRSPDYPEFTIANYTDMPLTLIRERYLYILPQNCEFPWAEATSVTIRKDLNEISYSLLKAKKKKIKLPNIEAEVIISGVTRTLVLGNKGSEPEAKRKVLKSKVMTTFKGFSVSLFSETSNEMFLLSVIDIFVRIRQKNTENNDKSFKLDMNIKKIQLDNMEKEDHQYEVIVSGQDDEETPFFQAKIYKISNKNYTKFPWIEITFQEIKIQINQEVIYKINDFTSKLKSEFAIKGDTLVFKEGKISENFPELDINTVQDIEKLKSSKNIYVTYLRLYALKLVISFKVPSKKIELKLDPRKGFGIGSSMATFASSIANITDSALSFTEILVTDIFQTKKKIAGVIIKNYKFQGIRQFYKLLGSSDMLGNPVRLMGKLGTGVFEFFSEPVKGVLKGPRGFKNGVKVGVKSLVTNIVGGGLQSVSTITGNLYNVVNKVKGQESKDLGHEKIGGSIVGGLKDIGKGVTGIFSKPWEGLKTGGGKGLFKGIGSGIVGAVTAPISAGLRISSGVAGEVSSAVANKKPDPKRIRLPKRLISKI